jgi:ASC-1-like (ASCH) protein
MEQTLGFPPVDGFYNSMRKLDYVKLGDSIIFAVATICAVIVGVVSYAYTAFQLYWEDNGKTIVNSVKTNSNRVVDFVFYTSTNQ